MRREDHTEYVVKFNLNEMSRVSHILSLIPPDQEAEDKQFINELMQLFFVR